MPRHCFAMESKTVGEGNYRLLRRIGAGSFGEIYLGEEVHTKNKVAVKLELCTTPHTQLLLEGRLYNILNQECTMPMTPNVYYCGTEKDYNVLVMDLLNASLEEHFNRCDGQFSLKTTLMLADQMIEKLEYIHNRGIIHRDIKPDNFMTGLGRNAHRIFIIDYGLSKNYRNIYTMEHIPYRENKSLIGTMRYCSINTHLGVEQSRRDDLESIGYILIYFLKGSLPWQGLKGSTRAEKHKNILQLKISTDIETLCDGLPIEFASYIQYTRALFFAEKPDYAYLRKLFRFLFMRLGYLKDYVYDWTLRNICEAMCRQKADAHLDQKKKVSEKVVERSE